MFIYLLFLYLFLWITTCHRIYMHSFYICYQLSKDEKNSSNCNIISSNLTIASFFSVPFSRCIKKVFSLFYLVHDFDPNITFTYSDGVPRRAGRVWKFWKMPSQKQQQIPIRAKWLQSISKLPSRKYAIKTHYLLDNAPN